MVYPGNPAWVPGKIEMKTRIANVDAAIVHWWRPVPMTARMYPVSIMVGNITEGFVGNPGVVPVPICPSPCSKRRPTDAYVKGTPEIAVSAVIIDAFPPAMIFKYISMVIELRGKILTRFSSVFHAFCPQCVSASVPGIPISIFMAFAGNNPPVINEKGR
jgi:hypothetical protein